MNIRVESPFPFEALPRVWKWLETFRAKVADDFSPATLDEFVSAMARKWDVQKSWAVYRDEELGGLITFERLSPWLGTAHMILKPDFQGKGIAVKACRIAIGEMFNFGVGKLAFFPLSGNLAIGSLLVNIGARREGTLIGQTLSGGKPTDMWVYGLSKQEFEEKSQNGSTDTITRRDGGIAHRVVPLGKTENNDQHPNGNDESNQHVDTDVHAGGPPAPAAVAGLPEFSHP